MVESDGFSFSIVTVEVAERRTCSSPSILAGRSCFSQSMVESRALSKVTSPARPSVVSSVSLAFESPRRSTSVLRVLLLLFSALFACGLATLADSVPKVSDVNVESRGDESTYCLSCFVHERWDELCLDRACAIDEHSFEAWPRLRLISQRLHGHSYSGPSRLHLAKRSHGWQGAASSFGCCRLAHHHAGHAWHLDWVALRCPF